MSLSVMFVDDEKVILDSLKRILHPLSGNWKFTYADSAAGALLALKIVPVDVIVADMCMPGMNGYELLSYIGEHYPEMVRVMMTGRTDYDIYRNGREISHYFLWKPVQSEAMKALLQTIYDQHVSELSTERWSHV